MPTRILTGLCTAYLKVLPWKHQYEFYNAPRVLWRVNGDLAGYSQTFANLTKLVIRNAGHEVPFFQPVNAFDMINRFLKNQPFGM